MDGRCAQPGGQHRAHDLPNRPVVITGREAQEAQHGGGQPRQGQALKGWAHRIAQAVDCAGVDILGGHDQADAAACPHRHEEPVAGLKAMVDVVGVADGARRGRKIAKRAKARGVDCNIEQSNGGLAREGRHGRCAQAACWRLAFATASTRHVTWSMGVNCEMP